MRVSRLLPALLCLLGTAGCRRPAAPEPPTAAAPHGHVAPHGGTLVELGEHQFNLEFAFAGERGVLQAWFLDGHAENFVRVPLPAFVVEATTGGAARRLEFRPVASAVTGETAGDTAQFEAPAPWLASAKSFDGVIRAVTVRGVGFAEVPFRFSTGPVAASTDSEHAHTP